MKTYIFETVTTMKEYNHNKYWIDPKYINRLSFTGENLKEAFEKYIERAQEAVSISKNAIKNKHPLYIERKDGTAEQRGYVITAKTIIEDRDTWTSTEQYIELWVEIYEKVNINFEEE